MQFLSLFPSRKRKTSPETLSLELSLAPPFAPPSLPLEPCLKPSLAPPFASPSLSLEPCLEPSLASPFGPPSLSLEPCLETSLAPPFGPPSLSLEPCLELSLAPPSAPPSLSLEPRLDLSLLPAERKKIKEDGGARKWQESEAKVYEMTNGGTTAARRVLEKRLCASDVSIRHCRLLLGGKRGPGLLLEMLTEEEKAAAAAGKGGGLPVLLVDRLGREYPAARVKLWRCINSYVLIGKWAEFVRRNELDPGDVIDVYLFRYDGGVGLVVCEKISARGEERRREEKSLGMWWQKRSRPNCR